MPRPSFHFRISTTLFWVFLLQAQLVFPAEAIEVEVKQFASPDPSIEELTAGTPPPEVKFPMACHIWEWGYSRGEEPSYVYAGCLVLHADYTVAYTPGKTYSTFTQRRIDDYNGIKYYKNPRPDNVSDKLYYQHTSYSKISGAPHRSWNAFFILLAHMIGSHSIIDHFAVTYGQDPLPGYVPEVKISSLGKTADGTEIYSYTLLNPLPGMRIMSPRDFNLDVDDWYRPAHKKHTPQ